MFNPETNRNPSENPSNRSGYTEIVYDGVGQKPHNNHNGDERPFLTQTGHGGRRRPSE